MTNDDEPKQKDEQMTMETENTVDSSAAVFDNNKIRNDESSNADSLSFSPSSNSRPLPQSMPDDHTIDNNNTKDSAPNFISLAQKFKTDGNTHFATRNYHEAKRCYEEGLKLLEEQVETITSSTSSLRAALLSNLSMVLIKLQEYELALQSCHQVQALDPSNPKVYYRRAMAREGLFHNDTSLQSLSSSERLELVREAMDDLRTCLELSSSDDEKVKKHLERLEQQMMMNQHKDVVVASASEPPSRAPSLQDTSEQSSSSSVVVSTNNGNHHHCRSITSNQDDNNNNMPSPFQQRQDIIKLLQAHAECGGGGGGGCSSTTTIISKNEAYFLVHYAWWRDWCLFVRLFENNNKEEEILAWLPPGAHLVQEKEPSKRKSDNHHNDDDSTTTSSDEEENVPPFPRALDNSHLILNSSTTSRFVKHWYPATSEHEPRLKPNLVRGYDYELLPREVYHALRLWYGEVTPPICRRVVELTRNGEKRLGLPLYPPTMVVANNHNNEHPNICGACYAPNAKARCKQCLQRYYCNRACQESHWPYHKVECKQFRMEGARGGTESDDGGGGGDDVPPGRPVLIGGRVGLHNLGNTCFMNSALICLSHATPLTRHFLSNQFLADVNTANPLGTGGKLAMAYEQVIKELWRKSSPVSPTSLKRAIAMFAPRFAGCSQHDAQEFLAFLLDGLHEDLNRIRKAPYVVIPDVTGSDMAIAGAEAWDAHRRRNDSLVMDTFYGQFKSTCVCPRCDRVSVSFDAFNHVSLEIPSRLNMKRTIAVLLFRAPDGNAEAQPPVRYAVEVKRGGLVADVRQALAQATHIAPRRLAICDMYNSSIYDIFQDSKPVTTIRASDLVTAYEVEPYTDVTIHAVCHHIRVSKDSEHLEKDELGAFEETVERFGFPFMTSFQANSTCRQVWEHVWRNVSKAARASLSDQTGDDDKENRVRTMLQIRIVDNLGHSRPVFLDDVSGASEGKSALDDASILPSTLDEELASFLGNDCASSFVFLRLEWLDIEQENPILDVSQFLDFSDHQSYLDACEKEKSADMAPGVTLDQCFETFTRPERLDEHNMWYCSTCQEHVRAMKTMELWRLPNILVVHLKRFEFKHALRRDKLDTFVECPLEGLDMTRHCAATQGSTDSFVLDRVPAVYDLFAVTNHYGRMGFGHYTAFARRWDEQGMSKEWLLFDDSSVQSVGGGDGVVTPAAYVLFYRRRTFA